MEKIFDVDIVILTVLFEEYDAICNLISNLKEIKGSQSDPNIYAWKTGNIPSPNHNSSYKIVVGKSGRAGTDHGAIITLSAVRLWKPRYICFIGIAGGLKDLNKGDVIIADVISGYEYGKMGKFFLPRTDWTFQTDLGLLNSASAYCNQTEWIKYNRELPPENCDPKVIIGNIASGDKVVDDPNNDFFKEVLKTSKNISAVEMEGAGVSHAIESLRAQGERIGFIMIRGISDIPKKQGETCIESSKERNNWKKYAAGSVAAFTFNWINHGLPVPPYGLKKIYKSQKLGKLINVPELPISFIPRQNDVAEIKKHLLTEGEQAVGITSSRSVGLQGMGGIGKTLLAASIARDNEVMKSFYDGIYWITIGQQPDLLSRQSELIKLLGGDFRQLYDLQEGRAYLSELLSEKRCLLILDDIWESDHISAFNITGRKCKILITTRNKQVIRSIEAYEHTLDLLSDEDALILLSKRSGQDISKLPREAKEVAQECGNLPLALAMVGSMLRGDPDGWSSILCRLQKADLEKIQQDFPDYPYPNLLKAIEVSVDFLGPKKKFYFDLSIFQEDVPIPLNTLEILWGDDCSDKHEVRDIRNLFNDSSLVQLDNKGSIHLHDLQFDYIRKRGGNLEYKHTKLLNNYQKKCVNGWASGPDDGYYYQNLAYHLYNAELLEQLHRLLLDFSWIEKQFRITGISGLVSDYQFLKDEDLFNLIQGTIILSAYVLIKNPDQLKAQLTGRLIAFSSKYTEISDLLQQMEDFDSSLWIRPLNPCLVTPGGALKTMLKGHLEKISTVAITPNGRNAVSGSLDKSVIVWDLETNIPPQILKGHQTSIISVAITPDGQKIVSSSSRMINYWNLDLKNQSPLLLFSSDTASVNQVAISSDGNIIAAQINHEIIFFNLARNDNKVIRKVKGSTSDLLLITPDGTIAITAERPSYFDSRSSYYVSIWEINSKEQKPIRSYEFKSPITSITLTKDNQNVIICSINGGVRILGIYQDRYETVIELNKDDKKEYSNFAITPDGKKIISVYSRNLINLYDLDRNQIQSGRIIKGHSGHVTAVSIASDGCIAITGSSNGTIYIWDLEQRGEQFQPPETQYGFIQSLKINENDGSLLSISRSENLTFTIWDLERSFFNPVSSYKIDKKNATAIAIDEENKYIILGVPGNSVSTNAIILLDIQKSPIIVKEWDLGPNEVRSLSINPGFTRALSVLRDNVVKVWDLKNKVDDPLFTLNQDIQPIVLPQITPDEKSAYLCCSDRVIYLWNFETGSLTPHKTLVGHSGEVRVVAIDTICQKIIYGSENDCFIRIGQIREEKFPEKPQEFNGKGVANCVSFNTNGNWGVAGYNDGSIIVWDLSNEKNILKFYFDDSIKSCYISPNAKFVYGWGHSGTMFILKIENYH